MMLQAYTTLPVFQPDQVLNAKDLNALVNYLEEQEMLTRAKLIGSGIVCGLEVEWLPGTSQIIIHKGVGITSSGHLMTYVGEEGLEQESFGYFEVYDLAAKTNYSFFYAGDEPISLYRLRTRRIGEAQELATIPGGIETYGVLLYLECFEESNKQCSLNNCDDKGATRTYNIVPLLVSKTDLRGIICEEELLNVPKSEKDIDELYNPHFLLPLLEIQRFQLKGQQLFSYRDLYGRYQKLVEGNLFRLQTALAASIRLFKPLLQEIYGNSPSFEHLVSNGLSAQYQELEKLNPYAIQYFYDYLCDLVEAYREFREAVFDLMSDCCPPLTRFPKHLRLGHLTPQPGCRPSPYRTRFLQTPVYNGQIALKEKVLQLHRRMLQMMENFVNPLQFRDLRITPSVELDQWLSFQSIPYYYRITDSLLRAWNPELTRRCRQSENLSYHSGQYTTSSLIVKPLSYSLNKRDFFRIEGHLGMHYQNALKQILMIRNTENLPFDIVTLKIGRGGSSAAIDEMHCFFRDLEVICEAWRDELACQLAGVTSQLSSIDVKKTYQLATMLVRRDPDPEASAPLILTSDVMVDQPLKMKTFRSESAGLKEGAFAQGSRLHTATAFGQAKPVVEVVTDSLVDVQDSLGFFLKKAITRSSPNPNEYADRALSELRKDPEIAKLSTSDFKLAYEFPVKVLANAFAFAEQVRSNCNDIDVEQISGIQQRLFQLTQQYLAALHAYQQSTENPKVLVNALAIMQTMRLFLGYCSLEQFKVIRAEMNKRKDELRRMTLFHEFTAKHPGIDHAGGVPKGGTFILVYHEEDRIGGDVFRRPYSIRGRVVDRDGQALPGTSVLVKNSTTATITNANGFFDLYIKNGGAVILVISFAGLAAIEQRIIGPTKDLVLILGESGSEEDPGPKPANGMVIADFYLPYNCCSDCPSIDYLLPPDSIPAVDLEIARTSYCIPTGEEPELFVVTPEDGKVTGDAGVNKTGEGNFVFDPNTVDTGTAGVRVITFQVNGQDVPLRITVEQHPVADFNVAMDWRAMQGSMMLAVKLENNSSEFANNFIWTFSRQDPNGGVAPLLEVEKEDRESFVQSFTNLKPGEQLQIQLKAINENCEDTTEPRLFSIPQLPENLRFSIFDIQGNEVTTPALFNNIDAPFVLVVSPGKGQLIPSADLENLKLKPTDETTDKNTYEFSVFELQPRLYTVEYRTPNGHQDTFALRVLAPEGGNEGFRGNFTTFLAKADQGLRTIGKDPAFDEILGGSAPAFELTKAVIDQLKKITARKESFDALVNGEGVAKLVAQLKKASSDNVKRIIDAGPEDRLHIVTHVNTRMGPTRVLLALYSLQIGQAVQLIALQDSDLKSNNPLSKLLTTFKNQITKIKKKEIDPNPNDSLVSIIKEAGPGLKQKPVARKKVEELINEING